MLSEVAVRQAKPKDKDYKLSDSEGLYLYVTKTGKRSWRLKYRFAGKERRLVFGAYPEVSLKEARQKKVETRKLLAEGRDPGIEAKKEAIGRSRAAANTFEVMGRAARWRARPQWSSRALWQRGMTMGAFVASMAGGHNRGPRVAVTTMRISTPSWRKFACQSMSPRGATQNG